MGRRTQIFHVAGQPVLPVRIDGTFAALKRGEVLLRREPLRVTFRDPIPVPVNQRDRARLARLVREALSPGSNV